MLCSLIVSQSIIAILVAFGFALPHNASILWRKCMASDSYRSGNFGNVIANNSCYRNIMGVVIVPIVNALETSYKR
jgi:hypothetical protein